MSTVSIWARILKAKGKLNQIETKECHDTEIIKHFHDGLDYPTIAKLLNQKKPKIASRIYQLQKLGLLPKRRRGTQKLA